MNGKDENGNLTAMKTQTIQLNQQEKKQAALLAKATSMPRDEIAGYMGKGFKAEDIQTVYTMKYFTDTKLDALFDKYDSLKRDRENFLKEYHVDEKAFSQKYDELFQDLKDSDKPLRDKISWRKSPFRD